MDFPKHDFATALPDLDLLCILEDFEEGESFATGVAFFSFAEAIAGIVETDILMYNSGRMLISESTTTGRKPQTALLLIITREWSRILSSSIHRSIEGR